MKFSLFENPVNPEEAILLIQQIVDESIPKAVKEKGMKRFDKTYRPKIQKWAMQYGMPKLEAEELPNDIYVLLRSIAANIIKRNITKFDPYLIGIVKYKVYAHFEQLKKKPPFELTEAELIAKADTNSSVLQQLCKAEQTLILKKALEHPAFSDKCRPLFHDHFYKGIALIDIAQQNQETPEAIRKRKMDCLPKLKTILINMGFKDIHLLNEDF